MLERQESGRSLREALEKLIQDNVVIDRRPRDKHGPIGRLPEAKIPVSVLRGLLAAHPVEPARPLLDREAVRRLMADALNAYVQLSTPGYYNYVDSFVALGRPMPTRAELTDWLNDIFVTDADPEGTSWATAAELLLALLNGES